MDDDKFRRLTSGLTSMGAWFAGNGPQYQQVQLAQEEQQRKARDMANLDDTRSMLNAYQRGDIDSIRQTLGQRIAKLKQSGGNWQHSADSFELLNQNPQAWAEDVARGEQILSAHLGVPSMAPKPDEYLETKDGQAFYRGPSGVYAKAVEGYQAPQISEQKQLQNQKLRAEIAAIEREANALPPGDREAVKEERKATLKANVGRIAALSEGVKTRQNSVAKARKFLEAFEKGERSSGAGRAFAGLIPGVWTDQGQFDEELDAFAEVAAREKLKAVGEIRPTDADVEGMKRALFSKDRDEETNKNMLKAFIAEQEALDAELAGLRQAKDAGQLSLYTGLPASDDSPALPDGVTEEDIAYTMQQHNMTREQVLEAISG